MEFHKTWQEAKSQPPQPSFCFWDDLENYDGRHASDLLRIFQLLVWNRWMEFNKSWQEANTQRPPPNLCFSGSSLSAYMHVSFQEKVLRYTIVDLWADLWPCQFSICYIQKISRHWIIRAPSSKMREPYSNHFVCLSVFPSVCPSVRLSTLRCNAITRKVFYLEFSYFIHRWRIKKGRGL